MDVNAARDTRKNLKLYSGALYGKSIMDAAKCAYFSGDTRAMYPVFSDIVYADTDSIKCCIDGREDKNSSWTRI